jgi:pSer/pThr/pTyr-binding forkhead associated (FHA) protein
MALYLEVMDGPDAGQRFRLTPGLRIGRSRADVVINDPKISSFHAQVEKDKNGQLVLIDRDSSNGLVIGKTKVKKVVLMQGVRFRMGNTQCKVLQLFGEEVPEEEFKPQDWRDLLVSQIPKIPSQNNPNPPVVAAFRPALRLEFKKGPQASEKHTIGYGPRKAGSEGLDIMILDSQSPSVAFELVPAEGAVRFVTQHPKTVLLNGNSISSDILTEGDRIQIGKTVIAIKYER